MTVREFPLPDLGEGLTEGEILKWLVAEGETITQNQPIVEVETAKAAVEIPAKWPGRVVRLFQPEGATVAVGSPIISIDTGGEGAPPEDSGNGSAPGGADGRTAVLVGYGPRAGAVRRRPRRAPAEPASATAPAERALAEPSSVTAPAGKVLAKPPVRKLARDLGVDLTTLTGQGPMGSITRAQVLATAEGAAPADAPALAGAQGEPALAGVRGEAEPRPGQREQRIPIKGVRKLTAENVSASALSIPHVTEFFTVDATRTMRALERLRAHPEWSELRISPLLLVAKAVLVAIRRHPLMNSCWDEAANEIVVKDYVNLGIAAATERGLLVPNIKDAGRLSLRELAEAMASLVRTAKAGRTTPAEMAGGTFSITNVGVYGIDTGTPILPLNQAAILAFGAIQERPWVHKGRVKPRRVTTLGLSFDHRIIDGELGSRFLADIGAFLTDPETALLAWG